VTIFGFYVRFLLAGQHHFLQVNRRFVVPKHGAYIFKLIKQAQELVQDKLVTINGFLRTMTINLSCKIEPSRAINR
jgi:hypothetical protein